MQFYILMIDYGRRGLEAVCQPELTRRAIVEQACDVIKSADRSIAFVKYVDGNFIEDVTADIMDEAETEIVSVGLATNAQREMARRDHARDLRKHSVA